MPVLTGALPSDSNTLIGPNFTLRFEYATAQESVYVVIYCGWLSTLRIRLTRQR